MNTQLGEQKNAVMKGHSQNACSTKNVLATISRMEKEQSALRNASLLEITRKGSELELDNIADDLLDVIVSWVGSKTITKNHFKYFKDLKIGNFKFRADGKSCILFDHPRNPSLGLIHLIGVSNKDSEAIFFIIEEVIFV